MHLYVYGISYLNEYTYVYRTVLNVIVYCRKSRICNKYFSKIYS